MSEQVLVIPGDWITNLPFVNGFYKGEDENDNPEDFLMNWLRNSYFMDRAKAETDESIKQLIPYCVIVQNDKIFVYKRTKKGGESRLHDLYSLGVGGHVNPIDGMGINPDEFYKLNLERELEEEVGLKGGDVYRTAGFIYDDSNAVGRVHIGAIEIIEIRSDVVIKSEDPALSNGEFWTIDNIRKNIGLFETWSQIVVREVLK